MALPVGTKMTDIVEISLRDQLLELEEKIFIGNLGNLKVIINVYDVTVGRRTLYNMPTFHKVETMLA